MKTQDGAKATPPDGDDAPTIGMKPIRAVQNVSRNAASRVGVLVVIGALVGLSPLLVSDVHVPIVARAAVYGIIALSMNILVGYTGQVSLGHAGFLGLGAFGAGFALSELGMPYGAAVAVAAAAAGVAALVLGIAALRITGLYLALVTIAFGLFAQETLFNIRRLTGGGAGSQVPRPSMFSTDIGFAYLCLIALGAALVLDWRLVSSKAGRAIQGLRDDERVAASWGVNVTNYKLAAFVLSGSLCGVAGALYGSITEIVTKEDFPFIASLTFLLMTVVGGTGNRWGVIQGGIIFAVLPTLITTAHEAWHFFPFTKITATWEPAIGAVLLILTLTLFPGGIAQQEEPLFRWLSGRKKQKSD